MILAPNGAPATAGDPCFIAYLYGVDAGETSRGNQPVYHYTVWQMFAPHTLIERGRYAAQAKAEGLDEKAKIWHFCREIPEEAIARHCRFGGGRIKGWAFLLEQSGSAYAVRAYIPPKSHIAKLLAARKHHCANPSQGRIFHAFRTLRVFTGEEA